jgi:hypothetical protein
MSVSEFELQQQLQQQQHQLAAMQQQFAAEKQQMEQELMQMRHDHHQLQQLHAQASASSSPPAQAPASSSSFVQTPRIDIRVLSPQAFHGTSGSNAHQWLMEVERYFLAVNLVTDAQRVLYASTFLKDAASVWYFSVSPELGVSPSWIDFKARFLSRFQPIAAAKVARAQLRLLKQRVRVAGYSQEFLRLVQLIPDMNLADQLESYMVGLHQDLAIEVEKKDPQTLLEAMEFAQRIELMTSGRRQAYGRMPGLHGFPRSASSSSSYSNYGAGGSSGGGDRMDLSAVRDADEDQDFHYGPDHPPCASSPSVDQTLANTVEQVVLKLNGMFQRGGGSGGGSRRGGMRGNGPRSTNSSSYSALGLSKEEFNQLMREGKCFKCKSTGHQARQCPAGANQSKN